MNRPPTVDAGRLVLVTVPYSTLLQILPGKGHRRLMHLTCRSVGVIQFLVTCALIALLEWQFSLGVAVMIFAAAVILTTLTGALLLRSTATGKTDRRNVLGGPLLPWAWIGGYGSMTRLCLANLLGSFLFGLAGFLVARNLRHNDYSLERIGVGAIACVMAWIVLTGMVLFLVRQYGKPYYAGGSGFRKFARLVTAPLGALVASIALVLAGLPFVALVVALIPIAIVFIPVSGLLLIMLAATLSGKPIRWN